MQNKKANEQNAKIEGLYFIIGSALGQINELLSRISDDEDYADSYIFKRLNDITNVTVLQVQQFYGNKKND